VGVFVAFAFVVLVVVFVLFAFVVVLEMICFAVLHCSVSRLLCWRRFWVLILFG
jgi:hypothetical protein